LAGALPFAVTNSEDFVNPLILRALGPIGSFREERATVTGCYIQIGDGRRRAACLDGDGKTGTKVPVFRP
jgi:hypothetical protein